MWIWFQEFAVLKKNDVGIQSSGYIWNFNEASSSCQLPFHTEVLCDISNFLNALFHYVQIAQFVNAKIEQYK